MIFNCKDAETQQGKQAVTLSHRLWTNLKLNLNPSILFRKHIAKTKAHTQIITNGKRLVNTHHILTSRVNFDPLFLLWLQVDNVPLQW